MSIFNSKKESFKFDLGCEVCDIITGYVGIVVSRCQWLHNCNTYGLRSRLLKDGKPQDMVYFDEPSLEVSKEKVFEEKRDTGGPCMSVPQTNR